MEKHGIERQNSYLDRHIFSELGAYLFCDEVVLNMAEGEHLWLYLPLISLKRSDATEGVTEDCLCGNTLDFSDPAFYAKLSQLLG